ncbi:MAG: efflux RND transporter periplasmic adaptor subunit [Verrucomicrobiota bacterium]
MKSFNRFTPSSSETYERLESCRLFEGPVREFWALFARTCGELAGGAPVRVMARSEGVWRTAASWPESRDFPFGVQAPAFVEAAEKAVSGGVLMVPAQADGAPGLLLLALTTGDANDRCVLAVAVTPGHFEDLEPVAGVLRLATDTPMLYQRQRQLARVRQDVANYAQALEVLAATNVHRRFLSVTMALVNELASRHRCSRVSLGWREGNLIKVKAVSGTDRFERRMEVVQKLEAAMEESSEQDEEIAWPAWADSDAVKRDHETYAGVERLGAVMSVPLRVDGEARGVLTLERGEPGATFTEAEGLALRVVADQVARRLDDLQRNDRWFGARWATASREWLAGFLGPKQTWLKATAVVGALLLAFSLFVPLPYRVNADFIVRAQTLLHLPAPYEGYLAAVKVRPGDLVKTGDLLLSLDPSDLLVELASARAERQRYAGEAERAEADKKLADLRAARAALAQADARVELIEYRLARAEMRAPFDGVVVDGDLRERIGAPVRPGDVLMKVSRLEGLYVEMRVPERDIDLIASSEHAEIAFTTRPEDTFQVVIERIEPAAQVERDGNIFVVRGRLEGDHADWLRPGMSGIAKVESERRTLAWIATHRLIDFLRLKLWW